MSWLDFEHSVTKERRAIRLRKVLTSVGRAAGNDVVLDDPGVGDSHMALVRNGDQWTAAPADRNGMLMVNGQRTRKAQLKPGDVVLLGGWRATYRDGEPTDDTAEELASLSMMEELVQLSADMMRDTTPERLFSTLLRGLVKLTHAEKGFIILFKDGDRHLVAAHNLANEALDLSRISDSIVNRVIETLSPLIVSDAMADARFSKARSVVDLRLSSVMCVPLIHQNDLLGVIYLGNDAITGLFTERDLTLLRIYASQAALVVFHALMLNQLRLDNRELRRQLDSGGHGEVVGQSAPMKQVYNVVRRVAPTDLSVLVLGETGTGKELVARELHSRSGRKDGPFVAINAGAIPENLLESELFGHRKGAFTGADADKIGRIEAAHKGTLFLDEIGEMPMHLQVKLLRVLQERMIERLGDVTARKVDVRVVSATNKDPLELIREGRFREDLFYRLNEVSIVLPPLRERGEDIVLLAQYFLRKYKDKYGGNCKGFTNQALAALKSYDWPGNVREIESRVKKALIMSDRALLNPDDLDLSEQQAKRQVVPLSDAVEQFRVDYIRKVLDLNGWNKAQTARDLGVDARTIFRYVEKLEQEGGA
ncbi:MAG TPA: sigma 54-interacting transcriptional regulator [Myxococcota bacterium]|nr:sigma 54-interacting transcriptional regulator [Myxococcota bacterium]